jgi:hypothetical protein
MTFGLMFRHKNNLSLHLIHAVLRLSSGYLLGNFLFNTVTGPVSSCIIQKYLCKKGMNTRPLPCYFQIVKHLPNSGTILCGAIDRDCHRERVSNKPQHVSKEC